MKRFFIAAFILLISVVFLSFAFGCDSEKEQTIEEPEVFRITYFFYEESPDNRTEDIVAGETIPLPNPTVTPDGFSFDGWTYGEREITAGTAYNFKKDVTLTARWTEEPPAKVTYTVNFELSYKNNTAELADPETPLTVTVKEGETLGNKLPELKPIPEYENYEFSGWFYKDDNGEEKEITADTVFTDMNVESLSVTVYAKLPRTYLGPY